MVEIRLHTVIDKEEINRWYAFWGENDVVFSLDSWQRILDANPDEKDFKFNIHCDGGAVDEGLAIYDALRTSGKNIYMNIEGGCHSMAVVMLLAAPLENRTANPNCRALIHKVWQFICGGYTSDELDALSEAGRQAENSILDIYADRTKLDKEQLRAIMDEQKERTADELLEWGFISKINSYTNNSKTKRNMSKAKAKNLGAASIVNRIGSLLKLKNYDFTDAEGTLLFTTTSETDELEVGMEATPDGTFTLEDGRVVTIEGGVITKIDEQEPEGGEGGEGDNQKKNEETEKTAEELQAEIDDLKKQIEEKDQKIADLEKQVEDLTKENDDLKKEKETSTEENNNLKNMLTKARNEIRSHYTPEPRQNNSKKSPQETSFEALKNEAQEKRNKVRQ